MATMRAPHTSDPLRGLPLDALRGRVMAVYSLAFFGFLPVGGLLAGLVAEAVGEVWTLTLTASVTLVCSCLAVLVYPAVRRL